MASAQMLAITIDPNMDPAEASPDPAAGGGVPRLLRGASRRAAGAAGRGRRPGQHHRPLGARRRARCPWDGDLVHPHLRQRGRDDPVAALVRGHGSWPSTPTSDGSWSSVRSSSPTRSRRSLRYYPLNWSGCRTATQDMEIGGQLIRKDDYVLMAYASANRDEDVWERPDEFDVTRSSTRTTSHSATANTPAPERCWPGPTRRRSSNGSSPGFPTGSWPAPRKRWANPFLQGMSTLPVRFES